METMKTISGKKTTAARFCSCMASSLMAQRMFFVERRTDELESRNIGGQSLVQIGTIKVAPLENEITELGQQDNNANSNLDNGADDNEITELGNEDSNQGAANEIQGVANRWDDASSNKHDSVATSVLNVDELEKRLESAAHQSHKLRIRMMLTTTGLGTLLALVFIILEFNVSRYFVLGSSLSIPLMLLGIMPSDKIVIRVVSSVCMVLTAGVGILFTWGSYQDWFVRRHIDTGYDGNGVSEEYCGSDLPRAGCLVRSLPLFGGLDIVTSLILSRNLFLTPGANLFDRSEGATFRIDNKAFRVPARMALERSWLCARLFFVVHGMIQIGRGLAYHQLGDRAPFYDYDDFRYFMTSGSWDILIAFFCSSTNRHRIMAFLNSLHAQGEAQSASSVAALVGRTDPKKVLQLAKMKFRQINFSKLEQDDFQSNRDKKGEANKLFQHTEEVKLGCCDAFMSHSWSDDGPEKYLTLKNWAEAFKNKKGRYPNIWLDKACIDQTDIESDLLCLPIFLAGCKELVIIPGETYTSRLWCIIEIFTFLKIGGNKDRITVLPIKMSEQKAKSMFETVDASKCQCWVEEDRQRLLGIIEEGFGGFSDFNNIIRHVFKERLAVSQHSYSSSLKSSFSIKSRRSSRNSVRQQPEEDPTDYSVVVPIQ